MSHSLARVSILVVLSSGACSGSSNDSRHEVAHALSEHLGEAADPKVGYLRDSAHLKIDVATTAFPTGTEAEVTDHARGIARFAYGHYEQASKLDSVSVFYLERARLGASWIRRSHSFPVADLGETKVAPVPREPPNKQH